MPKTETQRFPVAGTGPHLVSQVHKAELHLLGSVAATKTKGEKFLSLGGKETAKNLLTARPRWAGKKRGVWGACALLTR